MTVAQLRTYEKNSPVRLADGHFGLLIRYGEMEAGIHVPGEEEIRWIPVTNLVDLGYGHGALQEEK